MDRNKLRTFVEIIYNCPFVLLVAISTLVVVLYVDQIDILETDKIIAAAHMMDERFNALDGKDDGTNIEEKMEETEKNTDQNVTQNAALLQDEGAENKMELSENAGICKEENDSIRDTNERIDSNGKMEIVKNTGKDKHGTTEFVEYTPVETNSRYYSDAGKVALTTAYDYEIKNESYFDDAAFLGDSRTLGISDYAGLDGADFFCDNGMTIFKLLGDDGVTYQKTGEKVDMKEILQEKHYGKIYIMLGMNELGYGNTPMYMKQYLKVIRQIKEWQPGVIIYIMGNLHVSREKNDMETEFNNININDKNVASARLANGRDVFYLDCNPLFTDEEGYLQEELTFDGVHLYAQHYGKWRDFLFAHCVDRGEEETMTAEQGGDGHGGDAAE